MSGWRRSGSVAILYQRDIPRILVKNSFSEKATETLMLIENFFASPDIDNPQVLEMLGEASKNLPKMYPADSSYWISGVGPKGAQEVLNDLETLLQSS